GGRCALTPARSRWESSEGGAFRACVEVRGTGTASPLTEGGYRGVLPGRGRTSSADPPDPPFARGGDRNTPPSERWERGEQRRTLPSGEGCLIRPGDGVDRRMVSLFWPGSPRSDGRSR